MDLSNTEPDERRTNQSHSKSFNLYYLQSSICDIQLIMVTRTESKSSHFQCLSSTLSIVAERVDRPVYWNWTSPQLVNTEHCWKRKNFIDKLYRKLYLIWETGGRLCIFRVNTLSFNVDAFPMNVSSWVEKMMSTW